MSVRIKLVTRDEEFKVDESPIYVPVGLKKPGLSEVVNQLLTTSEEVPFDFLVDGKLLRSSLQDYLTKTGQSNEAIVTIEYVRAILPPTFMAAYEHDDWVSSVDIGTNSIATGSYDGIVRIWDKSGNVLNELNGHQQAVLCVKWLGKDKLVSGSRDCNVHVWNTEGKELSAILTGHSAPVRSIVVLANEKFVSASEDNTLRLWTSRIKDLPEPDTAEVSKSSSTAKRRKIAEKAMRQAKIKGSLSTLTGHLAPVTDVTPHPIEKDVVYSVSEDHTVRTWDLITGSLVDTKTTGFSLLSIASLGPTTQLLACGTTARHIAIVDPRSATHASVKQLQGHKNFVSSISPSPSNAYQFASGSHDGTVKLWDIRSDNCLYTINREATEDNDVFGICWKDVIAAGGKDKKLEITSVPV